MPELLDERVVTLEFADLYARRPITRPDQPHARTACVHQSQILQQIAWNIGVLKPGEPLEEDMPWRMALGVMFEEFYFSLLPEAIWQPGERIKDGIASSPDGLNVVDVPVVGWKSLIEETKCTEKKARTGEEFLKEWMYMHQGREYLAAYQEEFDLDIVRWGIMFYRGDYRGSGPICKQYTVRFSRKEIADTHKMLLNNMSAVEPETGGR